MGYDEQLAARVRALLSDRADVSKRKMFGGLTFMVGGNMCCGVNGQELIVRLDPGHADAAPAVLAMGLLASIEGGMVLSQARKDVASLRIAVDTGLAQVRTHLN